MRFSIFSLKERSLRLALPESVRCLFIVYFRADGSLPHVDDLKLSALSWIESNLRDPLRHMAQAITETPAYSIVIKRKDELPSVPPGFLEYSFPGELEEQRFRDATHAALVNCHDLLLPPRPGLWAAIASSRAIGRALSGVIFDPEIVKLLPTEQFDLGIPHQGEIRVGRLIVVPFSVDARGLGWMTTLGMNRLGLPNLQVQDVPPNVQDHLGGALNGVAQRLVNDVAQQCCSDDASNSGGSPRLLTIRPEMLLTADDVATALDDPGVSQSRDLSGGRGQNDGVQGHARIGLRLEKGAHFLSLIAPSRLRMQQGVWLNGMLMDLFGSQNSLSLIKTGNERMEIAHRQAIAELPIVQKRFVKGLSPGAILYVKKRFCGRHDEGSEFMWVVVNSWNAGKIRGQLANDPRFRLELRAGQSVLVAESEVYDWMISHPDGRQEGGYTSEVLNQEGSNDVE